MATPSMSLTITVDDPPHAIDKPTVTRAFEKLGADRVMKGHVALHHTDGTGGWYNCFLAMCYGGYGRMHQLMKVLEPSGKDPLVIVGSILGLTNAEVWAVVDAFDFCRAEFTTLVEEWLELNYKRTGRHYDALIIDDLLGSMTKEDAAKGEAFWAKQVHLLAEAK